MQHHERTGGVDRYGYKPRDPDLRKAIQDAADETDTSPSEAQRESGQYRKGKFHLHGMEISIETPRGAERSGTNRIGVPWTVRMPHHYGYIRRTKSEADSDHVDCFIGPHPESELVFVVDQQTPGERFDEHKVMFGFLTEREARQGYHDSYSNGWRGFRDITSMTIRQFRAWLSDGKTGKPIASQVSRYAKDWDESNVSRDASGRFAKVPSVDRTIYDGEEGADFRKKAESWARRELSGKSFVNVDTGKTITISRRGIRKTLAHLPDELPALALSTLPSLLKTSELLKTETPRRSNAQIHAVHYFAGELDIDGERHSTQIKVREDGNGHFYYDQHVVKRIKKGSSYKPGAGDKSPVDPTDEPNNSIDPDDDEVNEKYAREGECDWITIGSQDSDGGRRGGAPVCVKGGKIAKGPKGLKGRTLKGLSRQSVGSKRRQDIREAAKLHEVDAGELSEMVDAVWPEMKELHQEREDFKQLVRQRSGLTEADVWSIENSYRDHSTVTGLDQVADELAMDYPQWFSPGDDPSEVVWEMLREGKGEAPPKHDESVIRAAVERLQTPVGAGAGKDTGTWVEGEHIPFRRHGEVDRSTLADQFNRALYASGRQGKLFGDDTRQKAFDWKEYQHPRDADGKFASKGEGAPNRPESKILKLLKGDTLSPEDIAEQLELDDGDVREQLESLVKDGLIESHRSRSGELFWASDQEDDPDDTDHETEEGTDHDDDGDDGTDEGKNHTDEPSGTTNPRDEAESSSDDSSEYDFARTSAIPNVGEDLKGSARHKVNAWRSLEEAEENGTAAEFVTKAQLFKNEPPNLVVHADDNPLTALTMSIALSKFPAKPGYGSKRRRALVDEEENRKDRRQYLEVYRRIKERAEELSGREDNPEQAANQLRASIRSEIERLRKDPLDPGNNTANSLISMHKSLQWGRWSAKSSVYNKLEEFAKQIDDNYSTLEPADRMERVTDHAKDLIEGKSLNKSFALESGSKNGAQRFKPADAYVRRAERVGGPDISHQIRSANEATQYMVDSMGMRGVQWGNSVTDDERQHHATMSAEAFADLTDILGLTPADASLDGELGLAIGARGHGTAMAHYEPGSKVINLTRKNGVGSLAHEWGHFFDHHIAGGRVSVDGGDYYSQHTSSTRFERDEDGRLKQQDGQLVSTDLSDDEIWKSYAALRKSWNSSGFRKRLGEAVSQSVRDGSVSKSKRSYWTSNEEMFARSFERFIQRKLESQGRKNTYLAGVSGHEFWPTDSEVDEMTPHFEAIFEAYRSRNA